MLVCLNFCQKDRDQALRLLQWIGELGGAKGHDCVLSFNQEALRDNASYLEVVEEARKHFDSGEIFVPPDEDERGWPQAPNHAWKSWVIHVRHQIQKPFLWLEPDCVPIMPGWLDAISAAYETASKLDKHFLGAEVTEPRHRLSGVAVYPANTIAFLRTRTLNMLDGEAWDSFFAQDIIPFAQFTNLIQNVWAVSRNPDTPPAFPDKESLALLSPGAVLFHRCKDATLIGRLREGIRDGLKPDGQTTIETPPLAGPHLVPETFCQSELLAEIARLQGLLKLNGNGTDLKTASNPKRTADEQKKINARMAKARAAKRPKQMAVK